MDWPTTRDTDRIRLNYVAVAALLILAAVLAVGHLTSLFSALGSILEGLLIGGEAGILVQYVPVLLVFATLLVALIALLKLSAGDNDGVWWVMMAAALAIISRSEIIWVAGTVFRTFAPYMDFDPNKWMSFLNLMG
jgi:hypothetical protein